MKIMSSRLNSNGMLPQDPTREYYERCGSVYAERTGSRTEVDLLSAFAASLSDKASVVDLGCGSGKDLAFLKRHPKAFNLVGIDYSSTLAQIARARSQCEVIETDLRLYAFQKERYEAFWANRLLPHFTPVICQRVLVSLFAGLQKGGVLMVNFLSGEHGSQFEDRTDSAAALTQARTLYRYSEAEFSSLLLQSGFSTFQRAVLKEGAETWVTFFAKRI